MVLKVDVSKLKARVKAQEEKRGQKGNDPSKSDILKPTKSGIIKFRPVPYPHSADPSAEPFLDRYYHYGIPGIAVLYCPSKNDGDKCHVCDYIWEQAKIHKGTEANKVWLKKLPKLTHFVAGRARDRDEEGPKFLRLTTTNEKMGLNKHLTEMYRWFHEEDTCGWMDPEEGYDIDLVYVDMDPAKSKFLNGAKWQLEKADLARKPSAFGKKGEYEAFMAQVKNVDVDICPKRTTEDTLEVLRKWQKSARAVENVDSVGTEVTGDEDDASDDASVSTDDAADDLQAKMRELGI